VLGFRRSRKQFWSQLPGGIALAALAALPQPRLDSPVPHPVFVGHAQRFGPPRAVPVAVEPRLPRPHLFSRQAPWPAASLSGHHHRSPSGRPAVAIVWETIGPAVLYNKGAYLLEFYFRATAGTVYARIIDNLGNAQGQVPTASATFVRVRSGTLSLVAGREYQTQVGKEAPDTGEFKGSRLVPS